MNILLFQEVYLQDFSSGAPGDWESRWTVVGTYPNVETAKEQAKQLTSPDLGQPVSNRFAIYEPSDPDKDGIVDEFKFSELVHGTPPEQPEPKLRKVKRKK